MDFNARQKKVINAKDKNIICLAGAGSGKSIPNSTIIPSSNGWRKVSEIKKGDFLFDQDGNPTKVLGVFPQGKKEVYEITFGDKRTAKCCIDHIWSVHKDTWKDKDKFKDYTLKEILEDKWEKIDTRGHKTHVFSIPCSKAVKYNATQELTIDPYLLGVFLGDGSCLEHGLTLSSNDKEIVEKIQLILGCPEVYQNTANYHWNFYKNNKHQRIKTEEIFGEYAENVCCYSYEKSIPEAYKLASIENRYKLIQGLMDTDGSITKADGRYHVTFTTTSEKLKDDFIEVMGSLGYVCSYRIDSREKKYTTGKAYEIKINIPNSEKYKLFSLSRKKNIAKECIDKPQHRRYDRTAITNIRDLGYEEEMTCFYVDNEKHLFLMNDYIVTHNTRVLVERVKKLIRDGCPADKIVCITFTNLAAEEMKERLGEEGKEIFIGTIHSYANSICLGNGIDTSLFINEKEFGRILAKAKTIPLSKYPKVHHLLIDEFQDTGPEEFSFLEKIPAENRFVIGDERQCQPAGTKVFLRDGTVKNIEDIRPGDSVIWYDNNKSYLSGVNVQANSVEKKVLRTSVRDFVNEELITITTENGLKSQYTPNHICFTRLKKGEYNHAVYLMCDSNNRFRVGKIPLTTMNSCHINSWRDKMYKEGCTKIWLLKSFKTDKEARILEQKISYKYSIPQTCWQLDKVSWTKEDIDYIYEGLDTYSSAKKCLKDYHRDICYPLLNKEETNADRNHFSCNAVSEIYAINLMPECMEVIVYDTTAKSKKRYETIKKVEYKYISEPIKVYSLDVEGKTYVADGIVTHNCIYNFKGCSDRYLKLYYEDVDFTTYFLKENYRCPPNVIDFADDIISSLDKLSPTQEAIKKKNGYVSTCSLASAIEELAWDGKWKNWAILCRRNDEVAAVQSILAEKNIPYLSFKNSDLDLKERNGLLNEDRVKILTIHCSKGLEFNKVIVTGARYFNSEERRVAYVAATRAKEELYWCPGTKKRGYSKSQSSSGNKTKMISW